MGYYIETRNIDFLIPTENLDAAFKAVCDLNKRDELKTGGSYSGGVQTARWFAWMPEDYDQTSKSVQEVFDLLGFDTELTEAGLRLDYYNSKSGAEEHFLQAVSPYVAPGSFIEWSGEDGEMWRDEFDGEGVTTKSARIVWE